MPTTDYVIDRRDKMADTIYFDSEKRAYGKRYGGIDMVAEIDADTWSIYSTDPVGTTWDIIDGSFTELSPMEERKRERDEVERSSDRSRLYDKADKMIAKHSDYVVSDQDPEGSHARMINAWRSYKLDIRRTKEHSDYPLDVIYPNPPE